MKKLFFASLFFSLLFCLNALEWPLNNFSFSYIFGDAYSKQGNFQAGLVLKSNEEVKAAEYGKKLIIMKDSNSLHRFSSTLGNAIVLSHDKGLQTIYGGLKNLNEITDASSKVETFSILGTVGSSGWGKGSELTFQVVDVQEKSFINPIRNLLPLSHVVDQFYPTITGTILIEKNSKQSYRLDTLRTIKQGEYDLFTYARDTMIDSSESFMPFDVAIFLNGKTILDVQFYVLESNKGKLSLKKTKISSDNLYNNEGKIYLGTLSLKRGHAEIVISATDISQNTTRTTYGIQIE